MKHTSANMDGKFYDVINYTGCKFNISKEKIFKDLIKLLLKNAKCSAFTNILTEYQDHSPDHWETFYYSLSPEEIETFSKARQKYKLSISKMAFIAFVLFWKKLLNKYENVTESFKKKVTFNSYDSYFNKIQRYAVKFKKRLDIKEPT
ncbi:MAG: hypothetical protein JW982_00240 [Spirochaetes bacterium]|nr:hypothetical protein [Spirochaetota bacterium]